MGLRIIYGRAGCGKSRFCLEEIRQRLARGGDTPLVLVVPEQFTLQAERNLIKTIGSGGILRAEVLSFRRMAYRVFSEVGGVARKHLTLAGKRMLLYRLIDSMRESLGPFPGDTGTKGLIEAVSETISEFKKYNVTPQVLEDTLKGLDERSHLRSKLEILAKIYSEFEKSTGQACMDGDSCLTELARKMDRSAWFDGAEIWLDEFTGFTPQEYLVIEKLMLKASRVSVCLCTDRLAGEEDFTDDGSFFSPVRKTALKLTRLARKLGAEVEAPVFLPADRACSRFSLSGELAHLERHFFDFPYRRYEKKTEDIKVFLASNPYAEVERTAREIIRLCRDEGLRYRDIAVVTGNLPSYEKLVSSIFSLYGIPFFIDSRKDISSHPLITLILSALDVFATNWSYEAVFRYLKTGLTDVDRESVDLIENYVLAFGIRGSRWMREEDWNYETGPGFDGGGLSEEGKNMMEAVKKTREKILKPLLNLKSGISGGRTAREMCEAVYNFLCELEVPERIGQAAEWFRRKGELKLASEYSRVWNIAMEVFDQVVEVMGDLPFSPGRFSEVLAVGFGGYSMGFIPPALDQVLVGRIEHSRNHEVSALYILGVNDGAFPSASQGRGMLSDGDMEALGALGLELGQDPGIKALEEQYLVYRTLTTPSKYLALSCPISDHEGRALRPSIIVSRLKKIFTGLAETSDIARDDEDYEALGRVTSPKTTANELMCALRTACEGGSISRVWADVYHWYSGSDEWKAKLDSLLKGLSYSNQAGELSPGMVKELYGSPLRISVSRIESFIACPFSYYIRYGLKAKEREVYRLTPPDVGAFVHAVLERFSGTLKASNLSFRDLSPEECSRLVSRAAKEVLSEAPGWILNSSSRYKHFASKLERTVAKAVTVISEHIRRGDFEPVGYELTFGEGGDLKPVTVRLAAGEEVLLTGRIDRVDAMATEKGTFLRVVDYKSGAKDFRLCDLYYGLEIQLAVYLFALLENGLAGLSGPMLPGGMLYFRVDDPVIKSGRNFTAPELGKALLRKLKMRGLLLSDAELVKSMDREIDGESLIIPARITRKGELVSPWAADLEQFELLRTYIKRLLNRVAREMMGGKISIRPYRRKGETACQYCSYGAICQFDSTMRDNDYSYLGDLDNLRVWEAMSREGEADLLEARGLEENPGDLPQNALE